MRGSEVVISVVKCRWVKCGEVLQCSDGPIIRCPTVLEDIQTIGSCCLYVFCYYHILSYSLGSVLYQCKKYIICVGLSHLFAPSLIPP
jgi:hypothetical protein